MNQSLHILGPSFSTFVRSIRLYCEEMSLAYSHGLEINGTTINMGSNELAKYHPFKKVPVLIHGNTTIFETNAIFHYLDAVFPKNSIKPNDPIITATIDEWSCALVAYVDPLLVRQYLLEFAFPKGPNKTVRTDVIANTAPNVIEMLGLLTKQLANNAFFCGDFYSTADAILTPMLDYLIKTPNGQQLFANTSSLLAYVQRMQQRKSGITVLTAN